MNITFYTNENQISIIFTFVHYVFIIGGLQDLDDTKFLIKDLSIGIIRKFLITTEKPLIVFKNKK